MRRRLDLTRPVPAALIDECIAVAVQAPTAQNAQNWHWIVVTDADLRRQIGHYYRRAYYAYLEEGVRERLAAGTHGGGAGQSPAEQRQAHSSRYLADHMGEVPVLVIAAIDVGQPTLPPGNQAGLWGSLLPAAWSYALAARARGLGTTWTMLHLRHEQEIGHLLRLPETVFQGVLLPTAYFLGDTFRPARRTPLSTVIHRDGW
ncbi:nitroreductase family protein [Plantactinospora mayteni]|uniref:nitroreductase family protein n=1 Tax=Plantactinospora mayteni TaxID=566021 RepID=UPI001EF3E6CC|nr:nitroreductase family protein [Plantactinospora mayteni]